jgi:8-oxo-dGTP pyrophosphatase MutT (NUDIX family)
MALEQMRRALEPVIRRAMHFYWRFSRGMTMGVRAVVFDRAGRVFLIRHSYVAGWHLPGGGVEPGETLLAALARELAEEGNITFAAPPPLHGMFYNSLVSRRDHVAVYVLRDFEQASLPVPNNEIVEHRFFAPDALPEDATPGTRRRIAEVVHGAPISDCW